ncbi:hypothetical protein JCM11641_007477 [Rhodosporidiobolus odoratus]
MVNLKSYTPDPPGQQNESSSSQGPASHVGTGSELSSANDGDRDHDDPIDLDADLAATPTTPFPRCSVPVEWS